MGAPRQGNAGPSSPPVPSGQGDGDAIDGPEVPPVMARTDAQLWLVASGEGTARSPLIASNAAAGGRAQRASDAVVRSSALARAPIASRTVSSACQTAHEA
jgi:hypothetical protein